MATNPTAITAANRRVRDFLALAAQPVLTRNIIMAVDADNKHPGPHDRGFRRGPFHAAAHPPSPPDPPHSPSGESGLSAHRVGGLSTPSERGGTPLPCDCRPGRTQRRSSTSHGIPGAPLIRLHHGLPTRVRRRTTDRRSSGSSFEMPGCRSSATTDRIAMTDRLGVAVAVGKEGSSAQNSHSGTAGPGRRPDVLVLG